MALFCPEYWWPLFDLVQDQQLQVGHRQTDEQLELQVGTVGHGTWARLLKQAR